MRGGIRRLLAFAAGALACAALSFAQEPGARSTGQPRFEAASVKPNRSGLAGVNVSIAGNRFTATNAPALLIVRLAYAIPDYRIVDAPEWLRTERFDIEAISTGAATRNEQNLMLRSLLRERFGLVARVENRELPIYALVQARQNGSPPPRLQPVKVDCTALAAAMRAGTPLPPSNRILCGSRLRPGGVSVGGMTMDEVAAEVIAPQVDRPVVDRTSLPGSFDIELDFAPLAGPAPVASDAPSIFTALVEQLGLRLEPTRGDVEVLVIERVERPSPD